MSNQLRAIVKTHTNHIERKREIKLRKHLNADALFSTVKIAFNKIALTTGPVMFNIPWAGDILMAGFSMFSFNDPSLLSFDQGRFSGPHNLMTIYGVGGIPPDTFMREILDGFDLMISGRCLKMFFGSSKGARPWGR